MSSIALGTPPSEDSRRDAIHVAILPVKTYGLPAGTKVRISDRYSEPMEVERAEDYEEFDGVTDPFDNSQGTYAWMLVCPDLISNVRHDWELSQTLAEDKGGSDPMCKRC